MKNILTKIAQMERNVEEVNLSSYKLELGALDDLSQLLTKSKQVESTMVDEYVKITQAAKKGLPAAKEHLQNLDKISTLLNDIAIQADALGLDVRKEKQWKDAYNFTQSNSKGSTKVIIDKLTGF